MQFTLLHFEHFFGTIMTMGTLAVTYGIVQRGRLRLWIGQLLAGVCCGGTAAFAMQDAMQLADGWLVDLRSIPVAIAGAFLGVPGAISATLVALGARVAIGGDGMEVGGSMLVLAAGSGLLWAKLSGPRPTLSWGALTGLSLTTLAYTLPAGFAPSDLAWAYIVKAYPLLVPLHVAGMLLVGALFERERLMQESEQHLAETADRDPLTGLLNRRGFGQAAVALGSVRPSVFLCLDLDHFKRINDVHGHAAGDAVLRQMGERLRSVLRSQDIIGRVGGEEFAVLLPDLTEQEGLQAALRLCRAVRCKPFELPTGALSVSASVGGVWANGSTPFDILSQEADAALYAAKKAGRNRAHFETTPRTPEPSQELKVA